MRVSNINSVQYSNGGNYKNFCKKREFSSPVRCENTDFFVRNSYNNSKISFGAMPQILPQSDKFPITGEEALETFEKLKSGNYLDFNGGKNKQKASLIRRQNLKFLSQIDDNMEKKKFVDGYCQLTGFPDLNRVAYRIKKEFVNACEKSQNELQSENKKDADKYQILAAGYDGICSVGSKTAFPGSDLDKAYVILKGSDDDADNAKCVDEFKEKLWNNTDQRILSYNHDASSFPVVYTMKQVNDLSDAINEQITKIKLYPDHSKDKFSIWNFIFPPKTVPPTMYDKYLSLTQKYSDDYVSANKFLVDIASKFPKSGNWNSQINVKEPSREDIYNLSYVLETMAHGERLIGKELYLTIDSGAKDLFNLSQIRAIKDSQTVKPKYIKRKSLKKDFSKWDIYHQFDFIKSMIYASCGEKEGYPDYYSTQEENKYNSLLEKIGLR